MVSSPVTSEIAENDITSEIVNAAADSGPEPGSQATHGDGSGVTHADGSDATHP